MTRFLSDDLTLSGGSRFVGPVEGVVIDPGTNPNTLSLDGSWTTSIGGEYNGSPWARESGATDLTLLTVAPLVGTAVDGYTPANFTGGQRLQGGSASNYVTTSEFAFATVYHVTTADTDPGPGSRHTKNCVIGNDTGNGYFATGYNDSGFWSTIYNSGYKTVFLPHASVAGNSFVHFTWYKSGVLYTSINSNTPESLAVPTMDLATGTLTIGISFGTTSSIIGQIFAINARKIAWTAEERAGIYQFYRVKHPSLSL